MKVKKSFLLFLEQDRLVFSSAVSITVMLYAVGNTLKSLLPYHS